MEKITNNNEKTECIFCKDIDRAKNEEHIVQKSFGGNLILHDEVCINCNSTIFPPLDKELIRYVKKFLCWNHPDLKMKITVFHEGLGVWFDEDSGFYITARIKGKKPVMLPQLLLADDDISNFSVVIDARDKQRYQDLLDTMLRELANHQDIKIKPFLFSPSKDYPRMQPAIVRSGKDKFFIRAETEEVFEKIKTAIKKGLFIGCDYNINSNNERSNNIFYQSRVKFNFGHIQRALAKSALEFVCEVYGQKLSLKSIFDPIREFCISEYKTCRVSEGISLFTEKSEIQNDSIKEMFIKPEHHSLLIMIEDGIFFVIFAYYQKLTAIVQLNFEPLKYNVCISPGIGLFDYKNRTNKIIAMDLSPALYLRKFYTILERSC